MTFVFDRDCFAHLFEKVATQLETLDPSNSINPSPPHHHHASDHQDDHPTLSQQHPTPASASNRTQMLSMDRVQQILRQNQTFRPAQELHQRPPSEEVPTTLPMVQDAAPSSFVNLMERPPPPPAPSNSFIHMAVGGKVRVFPSTELLRAKSLLKKRSHALCNAHGRPSTAPEGPSSASEHVANAPLMDATNKQAVIAELVKRTNFTTESIFQMSRRFKAISGSSKSVISFEEFRQIMSEDVGNLLLGIGLNTDAPSNDMSAIGATISSSETFLRRLFMLFDVDGDNRIDFREFVVGLNGFVQGSVEDKVQALFEIYQNDVGHEKQTVAISDLLGLFQGDRHVYHELLRAIDEYFVRVELRDENTMKQDEFVAASVAEPHLLEVLSRPTPSRRFNTQEDLLKQFLSDHQLQWRHLLAISRGLQGATSLAVPEVIPLLVDCLGPPSAVDQPLLLAYVDEETANHLRVSEWLQDVAVALQSTLTTDAQELEAKARFYFELFDMNRDGLLSRNELWAAVGAGFAHFGPNVMQVVRILEEHDHDKDGELTKDEYMRAAHQSPLILASLYTCLHRDS